MKRICGIMLTLALLLALIPMAVTTTPVVSAAEKEIILIAGSDFQVSSHSTTRVEQVLNTLAIHGITKADGAFFCGDYTLNSEEDNGGQSSAGVGVLKNLFKPIVGDKMTFVQGNHDPEDTVGLSKSGNNDPVSQKYGVYVIHEDEYLQYDWAYSRSTVEQTAANLKKYLDAKAKAGWTKPIFILSHVGLHWGNRTILQGSAVHGDLLVDVLNEAGEKGLNVIFLYGHDHSGGYADFIGGGSVYLKKGDKMEVCTGKKKEHATRTLKFTYMNAGYIGYYTTNSNKDNGCDTAVTMSVFRIRGDEVIITRYDGNVNLAKEQYGIHNLKSKGVYSDHFYESYGYHVDVDTRVYASSRKVTATKDVAVATPMPSNMNTTTATTTEKTVGSGIGVQKGTSASGSDQATGTDNSMDATASSAGDNAADPSAPINGEVTPGIEENSPEEEKDVYVQMNGETTDNGPLLYVAIGVGAGAVLMVIAVIVLVIAKKKKG